MAVGLHPLLHYLEVGSGIIRAHRRTSGDNHQDGNSEHPCKAIKAKALHKGLLFLPFAIGSDPKLRSLKGESGALKESRLRNFEERLIC
jgi:hypothetical protein